YLQRAINRHFGVERAWPAGTWVSPFCLRVCHLEFIYTLSHAVREIYNKYEPLDTKFVSRVGCQPADRGLCCTDRYRKIPLSLKEAVMSRKLEGKVAIVTGASKGIGASIAIHLAAEGAAVVVNYSSRKTGADRVIGEIKGNGGKALAVQADVSKESD